MCTIEEKYNISYVNRKRYYLEDLSVKNYNVEHATPFYFKFQDIEIYENSWTNMIYKVALALNAKFPKTEEEHLQLANNWGKQKVFSSSKLKNYESFNNFYINLNHTAIHALWTLQLLISFYGADVKECKLLLRRHGISEPIEARKYFHDKTVEDFKNFLINKYSYEQSKVDKIIRNLEIVNKYMPEISKSYSDLFLFDDGPTFSNYREKTVNYLKYKKGLDDKMLEMIDKSLLRLYKYYYGTYNAPIGKND